MDLFTFAAARPTAAPPAVLPEHDVPILPVPSLPQGTIAWQRIVDRLRVRRLTIVVAALWTGEVLEIANCPDAGRRILFRDGLIGDLPADSDHGRIAYLTACRAAELHRRHGLALLGHPGTHSARFRFACFDAEATSQVAAELDRLSMVESNRG